MVGIADLSFEKLRDRLRGLPAETLDVTTAKAVRDRIAGLVHSSPSEAFEIAELLVQLVSDLPEQGEISEIQAWCWRGYAESALYLGKIAEASQAYEKAVSAARAGAHSSLEGQILIGFIHVLDLTSEAEQSARLFGRAQRLLRAAGDIVSLGKLHMNQGNGYYQAEDYASAYRCYCRAESAFKDSGESSTALALAVNLGVACTNLGRFDEAERRFNTAGTEAEHLGLRYLRAHCEFNHAHLSRLRGRYNDVMDHLETAETVFEAEAAVDMVASVRRTRAEAYAEIGMPSEATHLFAEAMEGFESQGMGFDVSVSSLGLARAQISLGKWDQARSSLERAETSFDRHPLRRAEVAIERGRIDRSAAGFRKALRTFDKFGAKKHAASARLLLSELHFESGELRRAEEVLAPLMRSRSLSLEDRVLHGYLSGRIALQRGEVTQSRRRLRKSALFLEQWLTILPAREMRRASFGRHRRVYEELLSIELQQAKPSGRKALDLMERARSRSFRELETGPGLPRSRDSFKRERLNAVLKQIQTAELDPEANADRTRELEMEATHLERGLLESLRRRKDARGSYERSRFRLLQSRIGSSEVCLQYHCLGDVIHVVVATSKTLRVQRLMATLVEIRPLLETFQFQMETQAIAGAEWPGHSDLALRAIQQCLKQLFEVVIAPIPELTLRPERLRIAPHRDLHAIPFEALFDGEEYLDEYCVVSRVPGLSLLRPKPKRVRGAVVVCGVTSAALPEVRKEIEVVARAWKDDSVRRRTNPGTTELLKLLTGARVLHIASHGHFRADNPAFSRIATADGAVLLLDLWEHAFQAELIVLSACDSGRVSPGADDGLDGVAHGFLSRGARQLVASRWAVDDAATRDLMGLFHRAYRVRPDAAVALRGATRQLRKLRPHPFYWSAFSVFER